MWTNWLICNIVHFTVDSCNIQRIWGEFGWLRYKKSSCLYMSGQYFPYHFIPYKKMFYCYILSIEIKCYWAHTLMCLLFLLPFIETGRVSILPLNRAYQWSSGKKSNYTHLGSILFPWTVHAFHTDYRCFLCIKEMWRSGLTLPEEHSLP